MDQDISKAAALEGFSRFTVVTIHQKWFKRGTVDNDGLVVEIKVCAKYYIYIYSNRVMDNQW